MAKFVKNPFDLKNNKQLEEIWVNLTLFYEVEEKPKTILERLDEITSQPYNQMVVKSEVKPEDVAIEMSEIANKVTVDKEKEFKFDLEQVANETPAEAPKTVDIEQQSSTPVDKT